MTDRPGTNPFKDALAAGTRQVGLWSTLAAPVAVEMAAGAGFDWLTLDTEHTPVDIALLAMLLQASDGRGAEPVVRVPWNDAVAIKRVLDAGARTVFVPYVQTPDEAAAAVAACRYPPRGIRGVAGSTRASGFGRRQDYLATADAGIAVIAQVETVEALTRLEEIAATDGLDGVFIGPSDLSASMGLIGQTGAPEVQDALRDAAARLQAVGTPAGILAGSAEDSDRYFDWGYTFVAAGVDFALLTAAVDGLRAAIRGR